MRKIFKRKYEGFSLIEMLLTMMILTVVMLLVATTLNTVIKVSNSTNSKNVARGDINYIMDIFTRSLANAELGDIYLYNSNGVRALGGAGGELRIIDTGSSSQISAAYADGSLGDVGRFGNEIHIKLYGYEEWTCYGFFKDKDRPDYGYIVKTVYYEDLGENHANCFSATANSDEPVIPLHSFLVDAKEFNIQYVVVGDSTNRMFLINATLEPLYWPVKDTFPVTSKVSRQAVVSTQALTWY